VGGNLHQQRSNKRAFRRHRSAHSDIATTVNRLLNCSELDHVKQNHTTPICCELHLFQFYYSLRNR
jgi:hypothetical protein